MGLQMQSQRVQLGVSAHREECREKTIHARALTRSAAFVVAHSPLHVATCCTEVPLQQGQAVALGRQLNRAASCARQACAELTWTGARGRGAGAGRSTLRARTHQRTYTRTQTRARIRKQCAHTCSVHAHARTRHCRARWTRATKRTRRHVHMHNHAGTAANGRPEGSRGTPGVLQGYSRGTPGRSRRESGTLAAHRTGQTDGLLWLVLLTATVAGAAAASLLLLLSSG
jgi:hypothetical protein